MKTSMALKPLAFALAALMAVAAQAGGYHAPTTAAATVNDGQNNHGSVVINQNTKTNASVDDAVTTNNGATNVNVLSGTDNLGKNDVIVQSADADFVFATVNSAQSSTGNLVVNSGTHSNASVDNSVKGNSGITNLNVESGTSNQGSNSSVVQSNKDGSGGAATINGVQDVSNNLTLNLASGHGWNTKPVVTNASIDNSVQNNKGITNVNVLSGTRNMGQNNVVVQSTTRF